VPPLTVTLQPCRHILNIDLTLTLTVTVTLTLTLTVTVTLTQILLESGGDPAILDKSGEGPYDVAKDEDTRKWVQAVNREDVQKYMAKRKAHIDKKMEERIKTTAEREAWAKLKLRDELIEKTLAGDAEGIKDILLDMAREADKTGQRPRVTAQVRDDRGCTLIALAAQHNKVEAAELLLTHWKECDNNNPFLKAEEESWEKRTFKSDPNCRDAKGWNCAAIAAFHESKAVLELLLKHGADPLVKNHYNMNAFDLVRDVKDAAGAVYKEKREVKEVLEAWVAERSRLNGNQSGTFALGVEEPLPNEGTATMLAIEFAQVICVYSCLCSFVVILWGMCGRERGGLRS
jgi:hypothetical protein